MVGGICFRGGRYQLGPLRITQSIYRKRLRRQITEFRPEPKKLPLSEPISLIACVGVVVDRVVQQQLSSDQARLEKYAEVALNFAVDPWNLSQFFIRAIGENIDAHRSY